MSPTIEIDDDVFEGLKRHAEPFIDTPNDVIRRLLSGARDMRRGPGMPSSATHNGLAVPAVRKPRALGSGSAPNNKTMKRKRAPSNQLLPEEAYELPILGVLADAGGRLPTSEAIAAVRPLVADKLLPMDRELLDSGKPRWETRVVFTRLRLIKSGLLESDSPRGVWEISDAGREHLSKEAVTA